MAQVQLGRATTIKKTFSRTTSVTISIAAPVDAVWKLLTDASRFSDWNSTVIYLEGKIAENERILLKSSLDPERVFKLKVKDLIPEKSMVWKDIMGKRTYLLTATTSGTDFQMTERIGSAFFPLFANKIPDFNETFERFASDLKNAAEK